MLKCLKLFSCFMALLLTACAHFPEYGRGGAAEYQLEQLYSVEADMPLGPEHGLRFDLTLLSQQLDILIIDGANQCFPASVVQAELREHRIAREIQGQLLYDAANDIIIQRRLLSRLERQMKYIKAYDDCHFVETYQSANIKNVDNKPVEVKSFNQINQYSTDLQKLLNSDNQFAVGSDELNIKYVVRLAEAAHLLRNAPPYRLLITGHSDNQGHSEFNKVLSKKRAEQVGRYLQIMGIDKNRIEISAVGDVKPLIDNNSMTNQLVNRRVTIEIIEDITQVVTSANE